MLDSVFRLLDKKKELSYPDYLESLKNKRVAVYGAGGVGVSTAGILLDYGIKVTCFIDDDPVKQEISIEGVTVNALNSLSPDTEDVILICVPNFSEVEKRLIALGYKNIHSYPLMMSKKGFYDRSLLKEKQEEIYQLYALLEDDVSKAVLLNILYHRATMDFSYIAKIKSDNQYFPEDIFGFHSRECFVDGGAYRGETLQAFINKVKGDFEYIYGFEPDRRNFSMLIQNTRHISPYKMKLFNAGLHSHEGKISFNSLGNSASFISEEGGELIALLALDTVVKEFKPSYIKLDIEGAEADALLGMKNTLKACQPKLAISSYHKPEDLWELPLLIKALEPSYRLYMRHYTHDLHETVCYGV